jgi:hypothetical protein
MTRVSHTQQAPHKERRGVARPQPRRTPSPDRGTPTLWAPEDVEVELQALALWDPATVGTLGAVGGRSLMSATPGVPSLVQLADPSFLLSASDQETLRERGFEVRVVKGAGHTIHRDDFDGFTASLEGWI